MQRWVFGLALVGLLLPGVGRTATYYVDDGASNQDCTQMQTLGTPTNTIQAAVNCMNPGDTVSIRAGTYVEAQIVIGAECTVGAPCVITGHAGDATPVVRPGVRSGQIFYVTAGFAESHDAYLTIKDLELDGINLLLNSMGIWVEMHHVTIENMIIRNVPRNAIQLAGESTSTTSYSNFTTIRNNQLLDCGRLQPDDEPFDTKGLGVYSVSGNTLIENNLIDGCQGGGIEINYAGNQNSIYRNNIIRNVGTFSPHPSDEDGTNGRGFAIGLGVSGGPSDNQIYNNVIYNIGSDGAGQAYCWNFTGSTDNIIANNTCYNVEFPYLVLVSSDNTGITFRNNLYLALDNTSPVVGEGSSLTGTISNNIVNPTVASTVVNAAGGNFQVVPGGPAHNTGATVGAVTTDIAGTSRPQGGTYDVGAYELQAGTPAPLVLRLVR